MMTISYDHSTCEYNDCDSADAHFYDDELLSEESNVFFCEMAML
jgi:hypothetical protein